MTTLQHFQQILEAAGEAYHILALQQGMSALITQRGARVLGVFPTPDAPNLFWTNPAAWGSPDHLRQFTAAGHWNLGGERCWIAPEIQYNVPDRRDFWGTITVPPAIDPGHYSLSATADGICWEQAITLTAYNLASGEKQLHVRRTIQPITNPLPEIAGVQYAGYEQVATLTEQNQTPILSEIWNLVQLNAGGTLFIPCIGEVAASDYFGHAPAALWQATDQQLRIAITGQQRFKVGYKSICMTGRMGYWHQLPDGQAYLLVRNFFNNPASLYAEEPPDSPGEKGHSVHVYNDDSGGFGEMECSGQTIGNGRSTSTDSFSLWIYVGDPAGIAQAAAQLLGARP